MELDATTIQFHCTTLQSSQNANADALSRLTTNNFCIALKKGGGNVTDEKGTVGQAKIYVQPIQQNLSFEKNETDSDQVNIHYPLH